MQTAAITAALLLLTYMAFRFGYVRSLAVAGTNVRSLHSRPGFYGLYVALWCGLPAFLVLGLWLALENTIVSVLVAHSLPPEIRALAPAEFGLVMTNIRNLALGRITGAPVEPFMREAAAHFQRLKAIGDMAMTAAVLSLAVAGLAWGRSRISATLRARNRVEQVIKVILILCSVVAIVTTAGIVLSMLFEALHFFSMISPADFFFGTVWDPRFASAGRPDQSGQFGLLPLLWGTLFISAIAMLVAVPIGLFSAIYLSEYASRRVRATAKPLLEILAGIPTVVFGFFALSTVGPFLRDAGAMLGLAIDATSALSAGVVMGIMIIPFVSSLSDDIINAVPQSLRDGSYGLGATRSETITKVVLPAALPGIVGSVLLAVSRAIGETMIVKLAAGIAANLTANPFESVTTVTVKIVTQLTGDLEFNSPQTLVAFALGLTLFGITLALNIVALYVVRKYREKYD